MWLAKAVPMASGGDQSDLPGVAGTGRVPKKIKFGQGLVRQCAREKEGILVTNAPGEHARINSSPGDGTSVSSVACVLSAPQQRVQMPPRRTQAVEPALDRTSCSVYLCLPISVAIGYLPVQHT